jgi:hypothetical protein
VQICRAHFFVAVQKESFIVGGNKFEYSKKIGGGEQELR